MTFWEFADKHIVFSSLMGSGILVVVIVLAFIADNMYVNKGRK